MSLHSAQPPSKLSQLVTLCTVLSLLCCSVCAFSILYLSGHCLLGDGKIVLEDDTVPSSNGFSSEENDIPSKRQKTTTHPVDLELEVVLGKMPQKVK